MDTPTFNMVSYFNYTQYKKLLFCMMQDDNGENLFYSYLVNHKHEGFQEEWDKDEGKEEMIVINTHNTSYYGKSINNHN